MRFFAITLALTAVVSAAPIASSRRDTTALAAAVDPATSNNQIIEIPAAAATKAKRDLAVLAVSPSSNQILEVTPTTTSTASKRDEPVAAAAAVDTASNHVIEVPVGAASARRHAVRDLAVAAVPATGGSSSQVVELEAGEVSKRAADGIVPIVVGEGHVMALDMTAENISS